MDQEIPMLDKVISPELQGKIGVIIESLANKLGVASAHVYEILVRQAFSEGLITLILCCASLLVTFIILIVGVIWFRRAIKQRNDDEAYAVFIIGGLLFISFMLAGLIPIKKGFLMTMNPEYYAIRDIIHMLK